MSEAIESFEIDIPQADLDDLKYRLERSRLPDQIEGSGWDYGTELSYLKDLISYWRDSFDWRAQEARLNQLDHFRTTIDGQSIHFVHARSKYDNAIPILISHGWPGSIVEFLDIIGPLTDPEAHGGRAEDAFHVVCPSLPGFGFSEPTRSRQWDTRRMAEAFALLMQRLNYSRYIAEGGDWGAMITTDIGVLDPEHLYGIHLTMPLALPQEDHSALSESEKQDMADMALFDQNETGYQKIQGTKPQTLGFGLNDSPAGTAAWIVEKFHTWSDCNGDVESAFTKDQLLTNISIYWLTQTITSSTRIYYEVFKGMRMAFITNKVEVPTGVARFPKEIIRFPRSWVEKHYNLTHWTEMPKGGHFGAMEQPALFVEDLRNFARTLR